MKEFTDWLTSSTAGTIMLNAVGSILAVVVLTALPRLGGRVGRLLRRLLPTVVDWVSAWLEARIARFATDVGREIGRTRDDTRVLTVYFAFQMGTMLLWGFAASLSLVLSVLLYAVGPSYVLFTAGLYPLLLCGMVSAIFFLRSFLKVLVAHKYYPGDLVKRSLSEKVQKGSTAGLSSAEDAAPKYEPGNSLEDEDGDSRRVRQQLLGRQTFFFDGIALADVFQYIRDVAGVNIHVKWAFLKAAGVSEDSEVNVKLLAVTIEKTLRVVLEDVAGVGLLGFHVDEGVITISTKSDLEQS